ncbi:MAG: hypothetical protein WBM45_12465 [Woeseiaceae bacterium]
MIGDNGGKDDIELDDVDDVDDELEDEDDVSSSDDDDMPDIGGDTIIDVSGEIEALVDKLEKSDPSEIAHRRAVRKRLEEIAEQRNIDLDSTFNFNLDDDF